MPRALLLVLALILAPAVPAGFAAWRDHRYLDSADAFMAGVTEAFFREWDPRYLRLYGSRALLGSMPGEDLDRQVKAYSALGPLRHVADQRARLERPPLFAAEGPVRVHFALDAAFTNADAAADIVLRLQGGQWKIESFRVVAPLLAE